MSDELESHKKMGLILLEENRKLQRIVDSFKFQLRNEWNDAVNTCIAVATSHCSSITAAVIEEKLKKLKK